MLIVREVYVAPTLVAAPGTLSSVAVVLPMISRRKKSSAVELFRCAKYDWNVPEFVPLAGRVIDGDEIVVTPPSTSLVPAAAPAAVSVTRALTPLVVLLFCVVTPPLVVP